MCTTLCTIASHVHLCTQSTVVVQLVVYKACANCAGGEKCASYENHVPYYDYLSIHRLVYVIMY